MSFAFLAPYESLNTNYIFRRVVYVEELVSHKIRDALSVLNMDSYVVRLWKKDDIMQLQNLISNDYQVWDAIQDLVGYNYYTL